MIEKKITSKILKASKKQLKKYLKTILGKKNK